MANVDVDDDDSVLEKVDHLVDEMLGNDIIPVEPEDPWEHRQRVLDSWTAIILAAAAVATTWASFQASQFSNAQSDAQSASAIQRSDANRAAAIHGPHRSIAPTESNSPPPPRPSTTSTPTQPPHCGPSTPSLPTSTMPAANSTATASPSTSPTPQD